MVEKPLIFLIDIYRRCVSPLLPRTCRFHPSCSAYAREALLVHGLLRGCWMTCIRLAKCHPYHQGGFDPVPAANNQDSYYGKQ